ncbi:HAMP domain-containing histidine kinase [Candidatus Aerophobetes bacterium]|nr:HAMP domain-containing histidine kinase [Candidatus Aerophobetes bacterium]
MNNYNSNKLEKIMGDRFGVEILNSMGLAVAVVDRDFNIVWANNEYHKIQEEPERSIIGMKCYKVSFNSDTPCSERICAVRRTFKTRKNSRGLKVIEKAGREKFLEVFSFPLYSPRGKMEYGVEVIQDNTRLYRLVELSDRLTAYASHELKTPLATINQLTSILCQIELPSEKRNDLYGRIISRSQHGLKTVENFLIYSRIKAEELEIKPVKINFYTQVIKEVLDFHTEYALDKGIQFFCDIPQNLEVVCDSDYIQVIYNNLITNAIKHGGERACIFLGYLDRGDRFHYFNVANTGEIIPKKDREIIFKRYVSGEEKGSGIGLDVTRELVERHGGKTWVESCYISSGKCLWEKDLSEKAMEEAGFQQGNNFIFTVSKSLVSS